MKTNICQACFQECRIEMESGLTAVGGTHANFGIGGNVNMGDVEVSDCHGEEIREVDSDLVEWHRDLIKLAESKGKRFMVDEDPEQHKISFDDELSVEEEMKRVEEIWTP